MPGRHTETMGVALSRAVTGLDVKNIRTVKDEVCREGGPGAAKHAYRVAQVAELDYGRVVPGLANIRLANVHLCGGKFNDADFEPGSRAEFMETLLTNHQPHVVVGDMQADVRELSKDEFAKLDDDNAKKIFAQKLRNVLREYFGGQLEQIRQLMGKSAGGGANFEDWLAWRMEPFTVLRNKGYVLAGESSLYNDGLGGTTQFGASRVDLIWVKPEVFRVPKQVTTLPFVLQNLSDHNPVCARLEFNHEFFPPLEKSVLSAVKQGSKHAQSLRQVVELSGPYGSDLYVAKVEEDFGLGTWSRTGPNANETTVMQSREKLADRVDFPKTGFTVQKVLTAANALEFQVTGAVEAVAGRMAGQTPAFFVSGRFEKLWCLYDAKSCRLQEKHFLMDPANASSSFVSDAAECDDFAAKALPVNQLAAVVSPQTKTFMSSTSAVEESSFVEWGGPAIVPRFLTPFYNAKDILTHVPNLQVRVINSRTDMAEPPVLFLDAPAGGNPFRVLLRNLSNLGLEENRSFGRSIHPHQRLTRLLKSAVVSVLRDEVFGVDEAGDVQSRVLASVYGQYCLLSARGKDREAGPLLTGGSFVKLTGLRGNMLLNGLIGTALFPVSKSDDCNSATTVGEWTRLADAYNGNKGADGNKWCVALHDQTYIHSENMRLIQLNRANLVVLATPANNSGAPRGANATTAATTDRISLRAFDLVTIITSKTHEPALGELKKHLHGQAAVVMEDQVKRVFGYWRICSILVL